MKYLKLYESDNYYDDVTSYWKTVVPSIEHLVLSKKEVDFIKNIVKSTKGCWSLSMTGKTLNFQSDDTAIKSKVIADFTKIDDDYYIISLFLRDDLLHQGMGEIFGYRRYYKCDQLDGLENCINQEVNWRIKSSEYKSIYSQELTESQLWSEVGSGRSFNFDKAEKFTNSELYMINDIFSSNYISDTYQSPVYKVFDIKINDNRNEIKLLYYSQSRYAGNNARFVIYKFPDEWFFIVDINRYKFYSCDQFEGLVECLKNNFYV